MTVLSAEECRERIEERMSHDPQLKKKLEDARARQDKSLAGHIESVDKHVRTCMRYKHTCYNFAAIMLVCTCSYKWQTK